MKTITNSIGVETKIFAETFEHEAFEQVKKMANFEPYQTAKIRIMPDAHAGKGCTVGTTMTITDRVTPNLVGVDIGCGMLTVRLADTEVDLTRLDSVINQFIPSGFSIHGDPQAYFDFSGLRCTKHVDLNRAIYSIGSLGGGNHFIEVGRSDQNDMLYLIIHSGSRKLGGDVCKYYQDKAFQNVNEMVRVREALVSRLKAEGREKDIAQELKNLKKPSADKDLAFLTGSDFDDYMNDMAIVQRFASVNRHTMADILIAKCGIKEMTRFETIHNYIDFTSMILRKGAVSAKDGELLLIPINMRDGSLLCVGKGNPDWNYSAPHGAGRLMSRSKAKQMICMDDFRDSMDGVYSTSVTRETLDEAPQAYKSMAEIVEAIKPTVDVIGVIKTIYNFKAH
jgi:tRNA-splicing ligase RtcB (3'-phosphate/5'-hydroxy nucleic acid ligase)